MFTPKYVYTSALRFKWNEKEAKRFIITRVDVFFFFL